MRITHSWTDDDATIRVEGLAEPFRLLHVTDSHIGLIDDRDKEHYDGCLDWSKRSAGAEDVFASMIDGVANLGVDLVAHTGDLVNYPARAAIENAAASLAKVPVPLLYTSGNHDWRFRGVADHPGLREECWELLKPFYTPQSPEPSHGLYDFGGVQFLLVDDSTYQVTEEQLAFVNDTLVTGRPTVLLTHIPLSIATLRDRTIQRWKASILVGDPDLPDEVRTGWDVGYNTATTLEFVRVLVRAENLLAVLCGHLHFSHADAVGARSVQYVTANGFEGGQRVVEFQPL